jgi:hypothetical protein
MRIDVCPIWLAIGLRQFLVHAVFGKGHIFSFKKSRDGAWGLLWLVLENGCDHHPIEPCTCFNLQPPRWIQISWRRCGVYQDEKQTARSLVCMCFASLCNHPVATRLCFEYFASRVPTSALFWFHQWRPQSPCGCTGKLHHVYVRCQASLSISTSILPSRKSSSSWYLDRWIVRESSCV